MNHKIDRTPWIVLGTGGQAKVVADIILKNGFELKGFLDDYSAKDTQLFTRPVLGNLKDAIEYTDCYFIIGIGDNYIREKISETFQLNYKSLIHPSAIIANQVTVGAGTVVHAGAIINPYTTIGNHCIINTGAIIEHDNRISDFVHISPGAKLGGTVVIASFSHIGIGVTIKNNISVSAPIIAGAGAVVVKNIKEEGTYIGVPARKV